MSTELTLQTASVAGQSETYIQDTTDVSQSNYVSGINSPAVIGSSSILFEEIRSTNRLTTLAWLNQLQREWPQQVIIVFASHGEKTFKNTHWENKRFVQVQRFVYFKRFLNTKKDLISTSIEQPQMSNKLKGDSEKQHSAAVLASSWWIGAYLRRRQNSRSHLYWYRQALEIL